MPDIRRIVLLTDFGPGIYVGQMHAWIQALLPGVGIVDLAHDLPACRPDLAAYLLPALVRDMPPGSLYLCVVDPGVGGERAGLLIATRGSWFVGPDNGLLSRLATGDGGASLARVGWRPASLSASFHGRDWFVPIAARCCTGEDLDLTSVPADRVVGAAWPDESARVVYVDGFGNLLTGLQAARHPRTDVLCVADRILPRARTFCEVAPGTAFWYENSLGLVEVAVNQGRADQVLGLGPGDPVGPFRSAD